MIAVNIQSKSSEPQTTITKFNINKANWHLFTSNEAWKEVTNTNPLQSVEALTNDFYKKIKISAKCAIPMIEIQKHFPRPWWSSPLQKLRDQKERFQHVIEWKKNQSRFQNSSPKEKEGRLGKICQLSLQQYTYKSSLEQSNTVKRYRSKKSYHLWSQWSTVQRQQKHSQ